MEMNSDGIIEDLVDITSSVFGQVTDSANKVVTLMGEIATTSHEQAQGIDRVNSAITEMSSTTQQNAANAEHLSAIMSIFKTDHTTESPQWHSNQNIAYANSGKGMRKRIFMSGPRPWKEPI
jgi:methyl-accepting chemotaxis protein